MTKYEQIDQVLREIDEEKHNYLDNLSDDEVNEIDKIRDVIGTYKIEGFSVNRDNETVVLAGGEVQNIGDNRLTGFSYNLVSKNKY